MASGPITSWEIDGETVETVSDFIFGAPKSLQMVTGDQTCALPISCLENPRDGGASWAAIHGVAQSRTRLKQLSSSMGHFQNVL